MFEKGEEKKKKKKKEWQSDLNPDLRSCSLAGLPLYHDVSHCVDANNLTNY